MNDEKIDEHSSTEPSTKYPMNNHNLSITKESLSNGFEYTKVANNNKSSKRRKLILHFDNRNTLQVSLFLVKYFVFSFEYY